MSKKILNILIICMCLMPALVAIITHAFFVNTLAIDGKKLQGIDDEIAYYERENSVLNFEKSKLGATSVISQRATVLGMSNVVITFASRESFALAKE